MKVSEKEWMNILLIDDWEAKYKPEQAHVYLISQNDWEVINKAFDKLQLQEHLKWTKTSTPFTFFCFVVWKNLSDETRKERVVIDIWALNKITMPDAYFVSSQADILTAVHGVNFIFTVDCSTFFYQWRVKRAHWHWLTVVSHWGQKTFKVTVMRYRNSPTYIQRMIDRILRRQKGLCKSLHWWHCHLLKHTRRASEAPTQCVHHVEKNEDLPFIRKVFSDLPVHSAFKTASQHTRTSHIRRQACCNCRSLFFYKLKPVRKIPRLDRIPLTVYLKICGHH